MNTNINDDAHYDLTALPEEGNTLLAPYASARLGTTSQFATPQSSSARSSDFDASQWTLMAPDCFSPSGTSFPCLPAGFYKAAQTNDGRLFAERQPLITDKLTLLPGSCNEPVMDGIRKFWRSADQYRQFGLNYKRGVLFYGPPGSGKTATINLLCKELVEHHQGAVFQCIHPELLTKVLHILRRIEPTRPIIVVMEDIDEIISAHGEHYILALLDGESQISNVVFLASTNYPDRLGARIVNRPSRFDERIFVDMPSEETRLSYLRSVTLANPISDHALHAWAKDTKGLSISHLRELIIAVCCLDRDYLDTISRLKSMAVRPKTKDGIGSPISLPA